MKRFLFIPLLLLLFAVTSYAACTPGITTSAKGGFFSGSYRTITTKDTFKLAFYTDTATYGAATTAYSATNEVSGTGYTAGGYAVVPTTSTVSTKGIIDFADIAPTTVTFGTASTCAVLYDVTASNAAIAVFTFSSVQPTAGTLTVDFPASGATTSTLRFAWLGEGFKAIAGLLGPNSAYAGGIDAYVRIVGVESVGEIGNQ
jgi:hypothetical protein